ncbi:MAG: hypothetical protein HC883_05020, partial [Bdellovibrionaceae bacterium]|nr:hypothetical protein [Pseudobdellovibrionaceae bacterium]
MDLNELIVSEDLHIKRLDELVEEAVREEQLLTSKLLELEVESDLTLGERLADKVATFGGQLDLYFYVLEHLVLVWV